MYVYHSFELTELISIACISNNVSFNELAYDFAEVSLHALKVDKPNKRFFSKIL